MKKLVPVLAVLTAIFNQSVFAQVIPAADGRKATALHKPSAFTKPLYVIDSLQLPSVLADSFLKGLDPKDILHLSIVKDKLGAARYGTAGTNGVVELTTSLPFVVNGQLLTLPAEKIEVLRAIRPAQVLAIRSLSLPETKRYQSQAGRAAIELTLAK